MIDEHEIRDALAAAGLDPNGHPSQPGNPTAPTDPGTDAGTDEYRHARAWQAAVEDGVRHAAGNRAEALLDSVAFLDTLDDLVELTPGTDAFRAHLDAQIQAALNNPRYTTRPKPDPGQGGGHASTGHNFANADHDTFAAEAAKYRLRPRSSY